MDLISTFCYELADYLSGNGAKCEHLVKFENTGKCDFYFPLDLKIWCNYLEINNQAQTLEACRGNILYFRLEDKSVDENQALEKLIQASIEKAWIFHISQCEVVKGKLIYVKLNRSDSYNAVLRKVSSAEYNKISKEEDLTIFIKTEVFHSSSITQFRLQTIYEILKSLISLYSPYILVNDPAIASHKVMLTTRSNFKITEHDEISDYKIILCGVVVNKDDEKKISQLSLSTDEYLKKRTTDMHLTAIHKYGVRAKSGEEFLKLIERLGNSASVLDMLETKHSNALILTSNPKNSFILYNSARLETLLSTFNEKCQQGYYPPLPTNLDEIDMSLLTEDDEWELLKFVIEFPTVVKHAVGEVANGKIALHLLYKYLQSLANTFSIYYNRKKLLTENRQQLIPVLHAKLHLLKAVQSIFNQTLKIFGIEPVSFM